MHDILLIYFFTMFRRIFRIGASREGAVIEEALLVDDGSDETENQQEPQDIFFKASQWCLYILAFVLPVWFLPLTIAPVLLNKVFVVSVLIITSLLFYLAHVIIRGRATIAAHWVFGLMILLALAVGVSSAMSGQAMMSAIGIGGEIDTLTTLVTFFVMTWMMATVITDKGSFSRLMVASGAGFVAFLLVSGLTLLGMGSWFGAVDKTFNTVGSWDAAALAAGLFIMMLYPILLRVVGIWRWVLAGLFIISLIIVGAVNLPLAWGIVGFFAIIFLSYAIWQRQISPTALSVSFLLLFVSLFGFFSRDAISSLTGIDAPPNVTVTYQATSDITVAALNEHLLFGTGPATFQSLWDRFRPVDVNQSVFWNARFSSGFSYIMTLLSQWGIIGWGVFILLLLSVWYVSLVAVSRVRADQHMLALSAFLLVSYTLLMWALYPVGYTLVALGFFALGLGISSLRLSGTLPTYDLILFREGPAGFISSLLLVFLMVVGAGGVYAMSTRYAGQIAFANALKVFNEKADDAGAEKGILYAISFDRLNPVYVRSLSQIYFLRAQAIARTFTNPQQLLASQDFNNALNGSIKYAQSAITLAPQDFDNHRALGKIYEALVPTPNAAAAAIAQYQKAGTLAPKNPELWYSQGLVNRNDAIATKSVEALKQAEVALKKAVELKADYTDAHYLLAQILDAQGSTDEAIEGAKNAAALAPNDIGNHFQLGFLYYKANRLPEAEASFQRTLVINENYSNARYFLGLIYDRTNHKPEAIAQFEKIQALNPDNQEVQLILKNLRSGKGAVQGLTQPPPDQRTSAPVSEIQKDDSSNVLPKKK